MGRETTRHSFHWWWRDCPRSIRTFSGGKQSWVAKQQLQVFVSDSFEIKHIKTISDTIWQSFSLWFPIFRGFLAWKLENFGCPKPGAGCAEVVAVANSLPWRFCYFRQVDVYAVALRHINREIWKKHIFFTTLGATITITSSNIYLTRWYLMDFPYTSHDSPTKKCPDVDQDSRNILSLFSQIFPRQSWAQFLCKAWLAASVTP